MMSASWMKLEDGFTQEELILLNSGLDFACSQCREDNMEEIRSLTPVIVSTCAFLINRC